MIQTASQEKQERLLEKLRRELGQSIMQALKDPLIIEIMLNPDGILWFDHLDKGMFSLGEIIDPLRAYNIICTVAYLRNKVVNDKNPCIECALPIDGSRFSGMIPEAVSQACFNIRKRATHVFTLDNYIEKNIISTNQVESLRKVIHDKKSILIVGGPGTGKTTFANALLHEMVLLGSPEQRFVIIEETPELQCSAKNKLVIKTTESLTFGRSLRHALVSRPDKICLGECRGAEVLTLLKAWNTGTQGGLSTLHANSAEAALIRVAEMIEENAGIRAQPNLICEAIDVIVSMSFHKDTGRRVNDVLRITGFKEPHYQFESLGSL